MPPTFPGYSQLSEIGGGGYSTVYRAIEESTGRFVALKVLRIASRAPLVVAAFDLEVRALASLSSHPNIVTLYRTLTTADGRPVLVMELCRESIAQTTHDEGLLSAREATSVGVKIAGALETAHRSGLLHRDLKPQNVLITQYGEPALADFGVAALQASVQATEGILGFTMLHAPPEVLEGNTLSPATDIYGLASTLYQLLAGHAPFAAYDGETPASVILRILRDPATPLRGQVPVPISLSDLLSTALAKDPSRRPASALAMAEALQQVEMLEGWPVTLPAVWGQPGLSVPNPPEPPLLFPIGFEESAEPAGDTAEQALQDLPPPLPSVDAGERGPAVVTPIHGGRRVLPPQRIETSGPPPADLVPAKAAAAAPVPLGDLRAPEPAEPISPLPSATAARPHFVDPPGLPAASRPLGPDYEDTLSPARLGAALPRRARTNAPTRQPSRRLGALAALAVAVVAALVLLIVLLLTGVV